MLIGPSLTGFGLGCFSTIIAHQSMDPCQIRSKIRRAKLFYLCPQMHPRPYYVSHSNGVFLPVPANAPTTLLCEPFQWGPVWDVWSTMLIGPWNPYTDSVLTGVFFYNNCPPVHGPMPHKIENPASQFFFTCARKCTNDPTM